ncbi:MAG: thiamine phosphate synthase [Anaerolineaceae bacterium]|nr:thiamine phosphate synthase [Anaerolineaceae bacterium]
MKPVDYSLYLVTDAELSHGRSQRQIVEAAIRGGVTFVQYREKSASTRHMIEEAFDLCQLCRTYGVPFIINDRLDVALAVDADGVHVGQDDMPAALARKLIGPSKILGVSVENGTQLQAAMTDGADYVGASPIFATPTKPDAPPPMGLRGLRQLSEHAVIPIVAIGGLNASNAADVLRAGASGLAVVSAIVSAEDVEAAARMLKQIIEENRSQKGAF